MAYATVEDVQKRTGVIFNTSMEGRIEVFLDDFSAQVDTELDAAGKDPADYPPELHTRIVANRAANWYYGVGSLGGVSSQSNMVGDVMETRSYTRKGSNAQDFDYDYELTQKERKLYGIGSYDVYSFEFDCN